LLVAALIASCGGLIWLKIDPIQAMKK